MLNGAASLNALGVAYHFLKLAKTQLCHQLADFLRDEMHEAHHVCRIAAESGAQGGVLRRDPHRTRVQVTDAHHDAPETYERRGRKAKFLCAQESGNHNITPGL